MGYARGEGVTTPSAGDGLIACACAGAFDDIIGRFRQMMECIALRFTDPTPDRCFRLLVVGYAPVATQRRS